MINIDDFKIYSPNELEVYKKLLPSIKDGAETVTRRRFGLKVIFISDTHGYIAFYRHRFYDFLDSVGEYDLCVVLGDIHPEDMPYIVDCIPLDKMVAVRGNHDKAFLYKEYGIREISGEVYDCGGVRFAGIDRSFPSLSQYESLVIADSLPSADILVSHDRMLEDLLGDPAHSGLVGIAHYIYKNGVQWHFHGHLHISYEKSYDNGTIEKSVYLCECVEV